MVNLTQIIIVTLKTSKSKLRINVSSLNVIFSDIPVSEKNISPCNKSDELKSSLDDYLNFEPRPSPFKAYHLKMAKEEKVKET